MTRKRTRVQGGRDIFRATLTMTPSYLHRKQEEIKIETNKLRSCLILCLKLYMPAT